MNPSDPKDPRKPRADLSAAPEWLRSAIADEAEEAPSESASISSLANTPSWGALLNAAVVSAFQARDLLANTPEAQRSEAQRLVLSMAERVYGADGVKWALKPAVRTSLLDQADAKDLQAAVDQMKNAGDPVSVALQKQISGTPLSAENTSLPELEAGRIAASWLAATKSIANWNVADLDREVLLRRVLRPFRRMVGEDEEAAVQPDTPVKSRFFGRTNEIERLRDYVGVAPVKGFTSTAVRAVANFSRIFRGAKAPMVLSGIGGVGKTTLLAKFALEHAEWAQTRYPFAYLDFDRTTVTPRRPALLLAEMCQQVGAQFGPLTEALSGLQRRAVELDAGLSPELAEQELLTLDRLGPLLAEFCEIVDRHVAGLEALLEFQPFLLIFDTFEIVQYSDKDVSRMEQFVRKLSGSADGRGWGRLRLVISGRAQLKNFLGPVAEDSCIRLGALDRTGSRDMLMSLTEEANRRIPRDLAEILIARLVGKAEDPSEGLHPLTVKLVAEAIKGATETDGTAVVHRILKELDDPANAGGGLRKQLIDGILVRRILEHVADKRVRALADPGLVVRRITPDVIRVVMAQGTPDPGSDAAVIDGDTMDFKPWSITAAEAESIYQRFREEVSLVVMEGTDLRHRQDLRQEMLPLIRARRPNRFANLHRLAFEHYRELVARNRSDAVACGEALYHGLWAGEHLEVLDAIWPDVPGFDPRLDPDEFNELPDARRFILAKARKPLGEADVAALPSSIAVKWLVSREGSLLEDLDLNQTARALIAAVGGHFAGLDGYASTAAVAARLLFRTGQWRDSQHLIVRQLDDYGPLDRLIETGRLEPHKVPMMAGRFAAPADQLSMLRTWVTMSAKLGAETRPLAAARAVAFGNLSEFRDPCVRVELLAYAVLGHRMLRDRAIWEDDLVLSLADEVLVAAREVGRSRWRQDRRILRAAILAARGDTGELLSAYLGTGEAVVWDEDALPYVRRALSAAFPEGSRMLGADARVIVGTGTSAREMSVLRSVWSGNQLEIANLVTRDPVVSAAVMKMIAFDHHDWIRPLGNALSRAFDGPHGPDLHQALRREDFLADSPRRADRSDGLSMVEWANSRGNLLRLVTLFDELSDDYFVQEATEVTRSSYPETVFGIAEALRIWHETNLDAIPEPPEDSPKSRLRSSRSKKPAPKKGAKTGVRRMAKRYKA